MRGITSKYDGDFYYLNCLHSFRTKYKLKPHENLSKNKDSSQFVMPSQNDNILQFNPNVKLDKMSCIIYPELEPNAISDQREKQTKAIKDNKKIFKSK